MSKAIIIISMMIFMIAGIIMLQMGSLGSPKPLTSEEGQTPLIQATANKQKVGKLDILFIGNSYTFMHSMPQIVINIAKSDTENPVELNIQSITFSGARLKDHWAHQGASTLLKQKPWDFVILQDQSDWATSEEGIIDNYAYIARFRALAKEHNEKVIVASFKTWPKKKDSSWYQDPETRKTLQSHDFMRRSIDKNTEQNAKKTNADIVPVADYWLYMHDNNIPIELYELDGSHPSVAGSYLNALVFYRYFTMSDLKNVSYVPPNLDPQAAQQLSQIAAFGQIQ